MVAASKLIRSFGRKFQVLVERLVTQRQTHVDVQDARIVIRLARSGKTEQRIKILEVELRADLHLAACALSKARQRAPHQFLAQGLAATFRRDNQATERCMGFLGRRTETPGIADEKGFVGRKQMLGALVEEV